MKDRIVIRSQETMLLFEVPIPRFLKHHHYQASAFMLQRLCRQVRSCLKFGGMVVGIVQNNARGVFGVGGDIPDCARDELGIVAQEVLKQLSTKLREFRFVLFAKVFV